MCGFHNQDITVLNKHTHVTELHLVQLNVENSRQSKSEQALIFQPSNVEHAHVKLER